MNNDIPSQTDIADWVKSLLPPHLWVKYCHLPYARMARIPELSEYAQDLCKANSLWYGAYKTTINKNILPCEMNWRY